MENKKSFGAYICAQRKGSGDDPEGIRRQAVSH